MAKGTYADAAAVGLSGLCIAHCLALPALASMAPIVGVMAEQEWAHRLLVLAAAPFSLAALARTRADAGRAAFAAMAAAGFALLVAGAFVEAFHDYETVLTVAGALVLTAGHVFRWRRHAGASPSPDERSRM